MTTPTSYSYSIAVDFPAGISLNNLAAEIRESFIAVSLHHIDTEGNAVHIWFSDALSAEDKTLLDNNASPAGGLIAMHNPVEASTALPVILGHQLTSDNRIRVAIEKSNAVSVDIFTHNWCDKTTWYQGSVLITDEIAADSGNHVIYQLAHTFLIDNYHGKITEEDSLLNANGNTYRVTVKVNDVVKTEQDPHYGSGGDYTVNYAAGAISFLNALAANDVVKVTYHYAQSSAFYIKPAAGKSLVIDISEVQFSKDVGITDTIVFQTYGFVEVFAPQLVDNPYPAGTRIPIKAFKYKSMNDYLNAAYKSYPSYPAMGGNSWRGQQQEVVVFDWDYQRSLTLVANHGMEVKIYLEHDTPFTGAYATASMYCGLV